MCAIDYKNANEILTKPLKLLNIYIETMRENCAMNDE